MSLTSPVSCTSYIFSLYCAFWFYICCRRTNHIRLMMSMTNLGLTLYLLARIIFALFLFALTSPLLVFWGLTFSHQYESSPRGVFLRLTFSYQWGFSPRVFDSLHYFGAQIPNFTSQFQNHFYNYSLTLRSQFLQPL